MPRVMETYIDRAAKQRTFLQSLLDDLEQVGWRFPQLIPLGNASREVLEALGGGTPRERFIAPVDPEGGNECCHSRCGSVSSSLKMPPHSNSDPPRGSSWGPLLSSSLPLSPTWGAQEGTASISLSSYFSSVAMACFRIYTEPWIWKDLVMLDPASGVGSGPDTEVG